MATMRALLALGLKPKASKTYEVVNYDLSRTRMDDLGDVLQSAQAGYTLLPGPHGIKAICKSTDSIAFEFGASNPSDKEREKLKERLNTKPNSCEQAYVEVSTSDKKSKQKHGNTGDNGSGDKSNFALVTRSLDSMIYYLGEIIRSDREAPGRAVTIWQWDGNTFLFPGKTLFAVKSSSMPMFGEEIRAGFFSKTYYVPSASEADRDSDENRSLQVLSLLTQVWGLNKTASALPVLPPITVIGR